MTCSNLREIAYRVDPALWVRDKLNVIPAPWQETFLRAPRREFRGSDYAITRAVYIEVPDSKKAAATVKKLGAAEKKRKTKSASRTAAKKKR